MHSAAWPDGCFASAVLAQALRERAAALCAPARQEPMRRAGYGLLRQAQQLECLSALAGPAPPCRALELAGFVLGLGRAVAEVCPSRRQLPRLSVCSALLPVWVPPTALAVSLLGLIRGSLLHAGPRPGLSLCCRRAGPWALVLVRDQGPGLRARPPEGHPFLESTELELARRTARSGGGVLLLDSPPQGGLTSALALPLQPWLRPSAPPGPEHWLTDQFGPLFAQLGDCCILPD